MAGLLRASELGYSGRACRRGSGAWRRSTKIPSRLLALSATTIVIATVGREIRAALATSTTRTPPLPAPSHRPRLVRQFQFSGHTAVHNYVANQWHSASHLVLTLPRVKIAKEHTTNPHNYFRPSLPTLAHGTTSLPPLLIMLSAPSDHCHQSTRLSSLHHPWVASHRA